MAIVILAAAGAVRWADRRWPPDLSRYMRQSAVVTDKDRGILRAFTTPDGKWRLPARPEDVDPRYLTLLRAYEDKRFNAHDGVDPFALARAAGQWISHGHIVSGGSTLTMQVARLIDTPKPRGIGTKLAQMARALQLERRYRKADILAMYLTLAPFGGNLEGARAASLAYFGKEPARLTLGQVALLVALPQSPERLRPDRHPAAARAGRDKVLARLAGDGVITPRQMAEARAEPVPDRRLPFPFAAPHLAQHLMALAPGAETDTWIDGALQRAAENLARGEARWFPDGADISAIMVENSTRRVVAYVGGTDFFGRRAGQLDLARRARSPGSALKPFVYGMAFDDDAINPASLIDDEPTRFGDYAPKDFDRDYRGTVSVRQALAESLNVPAVALLERVGPMRFVADLRQSGARLATHRLVGAPSLPIALGGVGISLADLTMLYVALANDGAAAPLVYAGAPAASPHALMSKTAAWYVGDILADSSRPDGWGEGIGLTTTRTIAFKTGTSYGYRDAWAVGFSRRYTVGVWVGRADGSPRPGHYGRNTATPIMLKLFDLLPAEAPGWRAPPPDALIVHGNEALPPMLRHFTRQLSEDGPRRVPPPRILFPADGMLIETARSEPEIVLKAKGGSGALFWIVNGKPLGSPRLGADMFWRPDGEGFANIAVIDRDGNRAAVRVRVKIEP
ncbi:MAG TPA: penicillin-binding protein 1C [Stellaceae bacterium]